MGEWGGYKFRPLRYRSESLLTGCDVYALQTGMRGLGFSELEADGVLGPITGEAIKHLQSFGTTLAVDGIAGVATQRYIANALGMMERASYGLPLGLLYGQLEHESSFWLGNYTPAYSAGAAIGSRDEGVAQGNTRYFTPVQAFDPVYMIGQLAERISVNERRYRSTVKDKRRRWSLAAGSWNAPAYADALAGLGGAEPTGTALEKFEDYMADVTAYMRFS